MTEQIGLPPEIEEAARAFDAGRSQPDDAAEEVTGEARLHALTTLLCDKRKEAIDARKNSGIEEEWALCEEAYAGIDDANRHEFRHHRWEKSTSLQGTVVPSIDPRRETADEIRSNVYPRLTSRYVNAAAAKLSEILFPTDDRAFSFTPTPVPDLLEAQRRGDEQVVMDGVALERDPRPEELPGAHGNGRPPLPPSLAEQAPGLPPAQAPGKPLTYRDLADERMATANEAARHAEQRIYDWLVEAKYSHEGRKVVFEAARLGTGVLKGPFPKTTRKQAITPITDERGQRGVTFQMLKKIAPSVKHVSLWNCFPDPACGEDIHDGEYFFERDYLAPKKVLELKQERHYRPEAIDQVVKEGPGKVYLEETRTQSDEARLRQFEVWYFHGTIHREDFAVLNPAQAEHLGEQAPDMVAVIATLINDTLVRAVLAPLESGAIPYHAMPWEYREGHWAGEGVGAQVRVPQRILTGATRAMLDNAGKSAGSQIVMDQSSIVPSDGNPVIVRDKLWYLTAGATTDDVHKAFATFSIPNHTPSLLTIIDYAFRLAEESTNMPLVTQGMSGATSPDTYGATQLQNNNANQLLRKIGYSFDDYITEPLVRELYEWLMLDPDVPNDEKGDWEIHAHGSAALVERAIQDQALVEMGQLIGTSAQAFGVDPKKWFAQMMKSKRLDPREFQYSKEEEAEQAKSQQPPPEVMQAQIRAEIEKYKADLSAQSDEADRQLERELKGIEAGAAQAGQAGMSQAEFELRVEELKSKERLALMEYANKRNITLDTAKTKLAEVSMKLRVQRELAALDRANEAANPPEVVTAPTEPPGRAPAGRAFQQ